MKPDAPNRNGVIKSKNAGLFALVCLGFFFFARACCLESSKYARACRSLRSRSAASILSAVRLSINHSRAWVPDTEASVKTLFLLTRYFMNWL